MVEKSGKVLKEDLAQFKPKGGKYDIPILWTGGTQTGQKAGTGAYILIATLTTREDVRTGALPKSFTEKKRFGMIRN